MERKPLVMALMLLFLAPAAFLAWVAREMPHFGHLHDDSIYYVTAKSLAEGRGYRILSLPGEPFQTKYPPLWPLMLAGIWKINPRFPENLKLALALNWLILPAFLWVAWRWFRRSGFGGGESLAFCGTLALSPYVIVLSTSLMSDLIFTVVLLAAILLIACERPSSWIYLGAGILGAAAYLVKTAALPLLIAGPLWLVLQKRYRAAAAFFCAMLPAVAWWTLWSRDHMTPAQDMVSLYYTNYMAYEGLIGWRDFPLVIWKNLDGILTGIAGLLIFDLRNMPGGLQLARVLAIAAIVGTVRFARLQGMTPYHWFAAGYSAILLIWHFPPNERFVLPVFPLLVAGLATEMANLSQTIRTAWSRSRIDRVVAAGMAAILAGFACFGIALNANDVFREFPGIIRQHRAVLASNRAAFAWIADHAPDGSFYAYDDPVFYLYTGQHAASVPVAPMAFYREDREWMLRPFHRMSGFAREQHLDYLFLSTADFHRDLPAAERAEAQELLAQEPAFQRVYHSNLSSVYRLK